MEGQRYTGPGTPEPETGGGVLDVGKAFLSKSLNIGGSAAGAVADYPHLLPGVGALPLVSESARVIQDLSNEAADVVYKSISPKNRAAIESAIVPNPGQASMMDMPFRALGMKAAAMSPYLLGGAAVTAATGGGAIPVLALGAGFGGLSVAEEHNEQRQSIMNAPDARLQAQSPYYRELRLSMDVDAAKARMIDQARSPEDDLATFATNTAAGVGFMGAGRGVKGLLPKIGLGAAELGPTQGIAMAQGDISRQRSEQRTGMRPPGDLDLMSAVRSGLSGAVEGAVLGGVMGAFHHWTGRPTDAVPPDLAAGTSGVLQLGGPTPGPPQLGGPGQQRMLGSPNDYRDTTNTRRWATTPGYGVGDRFGPAGQQPLQIESQVGPNDPYAKPAPYPSEPPPRQLPGPPGGTPDFGPTTRDPQGDPNIPGGPAYPMQPPTPTTTPEAQQRAASAEQRAGRPTIMRTTDGSLYQLHPDGTTTLGDDGPRSDMTVYVDAKLADAIERISQIRADADVQIDPAGGRVTVTDMYEGRPQRYAFDADGTNNRFSAVPGRGLVPLQLFDYADRGYKVAHVGSPIVVTRRGEARPPPQYARTSPATEAARAPSAEVSWTGRGQTPKAPWQAGERIVRTPNLPERERTNLPPGFAGQKALPTRGGRQVGPEVSGEERTARGWIAPLGDAVLPGDTRMQATGQLSPTQQRGPFQMRGTNEPRHITTTARTPYEQLVTERDTRSSGQSQPKPGRDLVMAEPSVTQPRRPLTAEEKRARGNQPLTAEELKRRGGKPLTAKEIAERGERPPQKTRGQLLMEARKRQRDRARMAEEAKEKQAVIDRLERVGAYGDVPAVRRMLEEQPAPGQAVGPFKPRELSTQRGVPTVRYKNSKGQTVTLTGRKALEHREDFGGPVVFDLGLSSAFPEEVAKENMRQRMAKRAATHLSRAEKERERRQKLIVEDEVKAGKLLEAARARDEAAFVTDKKLWQALSDPDPDVSKAARDRVVGSARKLLTEASGKLSKGRAENKRARSTAAMVALREEAALEGRATPKVIDDQPNLQRYRLMRALVDNVAEHTGDMAASAAQRERGIKNTFETYVRELQNLEARKAEFELETLQDRETQKFLDKAERAEARREAKDAAEGATKPGTSLRKDSREGLQDQLRRLVRDTVATQWHKAKNPADRARLMADFKGYSELIAGRPAPKGWVEPTAATRPELFSAAPRATLSLKPKEQPPGVVPPKRLPAPAVPLDQHPFGRPVHQPGVPLDEHPFGRPVHEPGKPVPVPLDEHPFGRPVHEPTPLDAPARAEAEAKAADPTSATTPEQDAAAHYGRKPNGENPSIRVADEMPFLKAQLTKLAERWKDAKSRALGKLLNAMLDKIGSRIGSTRIEIFHPGDKLGRHAQGARFEYMEQGALLRGQRGIIAVPYDMAVGPEGLKTITHEVAHAATQHALESGTRRANTLKRDLETMGKMVRTTLDNDPALLREMGFTDLEAAQIKNFDNAAEFLAEATSIGSGSLQKLLITLETPKYIADRMGLPRNSSLWDALITRVARAFGLTKAERSMFDAVMRISDELAAYDPPRTKIGVETFRREAEKGRARRVNLAPVGERILEAAKQAVPSAMRSKRWLGDNVLKVATLEGIGRAGRSAYKAIDAVGRTVADRVVRSVSRMNGLQDAIAKRVVQPVYDRARELERRYTASGKWGDYQTLRIDETQFQVFAHLPLDQQTHFATKAMRDAQGKPLKDAAGKTRREVDPDALGDVQSRAQWKRLNDTWKALPKEIQDFHLRQHRPFLERMHGWAADLIVYNNIRELLPNLSKVRQQTLATQLRNNTIDSATLERLYPDVHDALSALRDHPALKKLPVYSPLYRNGDYVVHGTYRVATPRGAQRIDRDGTPNPAGNTYRFDSHAEAAAFLKSLPIKSTGQRTTYMNGTQKIGKAEWDKGIGRRYYDVDVSHKHVEFFERFKDAEARYNELRNHPVQPGGLPLDLNPPENRRWRPAEVSRAFLSREYHRNIERLQRSDAHRNKPQAVREYAENMMMEMALMSMGSTRIQSSHLPRTGASGASPEVPNNVGRYGLNYAGYISRLKHMPETDAAMAAMNVERNERASEGLAGHAARERIHNEFERRIYDPAESHRRNLFWNVGSRLLQLSFLDKLASPMFHMINSMETWTISLPEIAGRHGFGNTMKIMHQAGMDLGGLHWTVREGARDTVKAWRDAAKLTDFNESYSDRLRRKGVSDAEEIVGMMDEAAARGLVGKSAGMELQEMMLRSDWKALQALDRVDHMSRQMGGAIESYNRWKTGMTAFRAEKARQLREGTEYELAVDRAHQYGIDMIYKTMGDYSAWNSPKIMNHPLGRLAFQFKKYGLKMYQLMIMNAAAAIKGDREALKSLGGVIATHVLMAGTLGLPVEALKVAAMIAGLIDDDLGVESLEQKWRHFLVDHLGQDLGVIAARGLPRHMGIDMQRVGLDNLMLPMGQPKGDKPGDLGQYFAQATLGAPFAMAFEWPRGVNKMLNGDILGGSIDLVPLKAYADSATAVQRLMQGKLTPGGKQAMDPYTPGEAMVRMLGGTPGREAETNELRGYVQHEKAKRTKTRREEIAEWLTAPDERSRERIWQDIQSKNDSLPPAARLTREMLGAAEERRRNDRVTGREQWGISFGRAEQDIAQRGQMYYQAR